MHLKVRVMQSCLLQLRLPFHPLLREWIVCFFVKLFAFGKVAFCKLTGAGYVPDLDIIFVFCFSNAASNTLDYTNKTFARLNENKIKYARNINPNSRNSVGRNNNLAFRYLYFIIMVLTLAGFGCTGYKHTVGQTFYQLLTGIYPVDQYQCVTCIVNLINKASNRV